MAKEEINAFLGASTEYEGKLSFQGAVRIDGNFKGEIDSEGSLIVGKDAVIEGVVQVGELVNSGLFKGKIVAKRKVTIHREGKILGDIFTPILNVEEGAVIDGRINMGNTANAQLVEE